MGHYVLSGADLQADDVNTMSAAMTQAKATGQNVSVKLTDGTMFVATPKDMDESPSSSPSSTFIVVGIIAIFGLMFLRGK